MSKKLYYKIGEACREFGIQPYVLRYWESEFPFLQPDKSGSGQRVYSRRELDLIGRIKELLYEEGYTIAGAKKKLEGELASGASKVEKSGARKGTNKRKASAPDNGADGADGGAPVDSEAGDRIETIARGLRDLHKEAQEILSLLESSRDR